MTDQIVDEKVQFPEQPLGGDGAEVLADEPKRKRGRPRKEGDDERPLTPEPPPRSKKRAGTHEDPYAAIHRCHREMEAHVRNLRDVHPETECSDPINPLDVKKDVRGAPIEHTAFHAPVIGLCKLSGYLGDLREDELPNQEAYDRCANSWARTSTHLGLSEKAASLFSSISETVYVVGFTAAKAIRNAFVGRPPTDEVKKDEAPLVDGERAKSDA